MKLIIITSLMIGTTLAAFSFPSSPQIEDRMGNGGPDNYGGPVGYSNTSGTPGRPLDTDNRTETEESKINSASDKKNGAPSLISGIEGYSYFISGYDPGSELTNKSQSSNVNGKNESATSNLISGSED